MPADRHPRALADAKRCPARRLVTRLVCCVLVVACEPGHAPSPPSPAAARSGQSARGRAGVEPRREPSVAPAPPGDALDYVEFTTGSAPRDPALALIVGIHGLGDRPDQFADLFRGFPHAARFIVPRAPTAYANGYSWFPYERPRNEERTARGIRTAAERIAELVRTVRARAPSRGRAIVTGFSQGGMLSFELAVHHAEEFRAAFPLSGWLPRPRWPEARPEAAKDLRIVALHGDQDSVVPLGPTRSGVEHLAALGFDIDLQTFPGVAHAVPSGVRARLFELLAEAMDGKMPVEARPRTHRHETTRTGR